jgi:hypothetical protein
VGSTPTSGTNNSIPLRHLGRLLRQTVPRAKTPVGQSWGNPRETHEAGQGGPRARTGQYEPVSRAIVARWPARGGETGRIAALVRRSRDFAGPRQPSACGTSVGARRAAAAGSGRWPSNSDVDGMADPPADAGQHYHESSPACRVSVDSETIARTSSSSRVSRSSSAAATRSISGQ